MRESREHIKIGLNVAALIVATSSLIIYYIIKPNDDDLTIYRIWLTVIAVIVGMYAAHMARKTTLLRNKRRVFIMYTHEDSEAAQKLVNRLREAGFDLWFDKDELTPGQRIHEAVGMGIQQCSAAVLLVSKHTHDPSKFLRFQMDMALNSLPSKSSEFSPIIPVQLDEEPLPDQLQGVISIKLKSEEDFVKLIKGLKLILDKS